MAASSKSRIQNGFLSVEPLEYSTGTSAHRRSDSVARSEKSSRSRITLVEDDPEIVSYQDPTIQNNSETVHYELPKYSWFDHLLGVMCINISKRKQPIMCDTCRPVAPTPHADGEDYSPWVLPVSVLSTRRDTSKHLIPKVAKCTLDTGNWQGNIVSRKFAIEVLENQEANIRELTEDEKKGGVGITGDRLVPEGAIYLTWYHQKSTRVFRNMRFLISPNPHYDLIIGARSIMKDKLLDVPNLMAEPAAGVGKIIVPPADGDKELERLRHYKTDLKNEIDSKDIEMEENEGDSKKVKKIEAEISQLTARLEEAEEKYEFRELELKGNKMTDMEVKRYDELKAKYESKETYVGNASSAGPSGSDAGAGHAHRRKN